VPINMPFRSAIGSIPMETASLLNEAQRASVRRKACRIVFLLTSLNLAA
jgi:hypothetical protein